MILICGCTIFKDKPVEYDGISDFSIVYTSSQEFPRFSETEIKISSSGDYSYIEYDTDKPKMGEEKQKELVEDIEGKLNETELNEFIIFVIEENNFFGLPIELDDYNVLDGSSSYIQVTYKERIRKVGGYGVNNKRFGEIASKLYKYRFNFIE